jgi:hypothetical protein
MSLEILARLLAAGAQGARETDSKASLAEILASALEAASQEAYSLHRTRGAEDEGQREVPRRWET